MSQALSLSANLPPVKLIALYESLNHVLLQREWPALLSSIVTQASALLHACCGELYLCAAARRGLELAHSRNDAPGDGLHPGWGKGIADRALQMGRAMVDEEPVANSASTHALRFTSAAVPFTPPDGLAGVLVLGDATPQRFTPPDLDLLAVFVGLITGVLYQATQLEQSRRRLTALEVAGKVSSQLRGAHSLDAALKLLLDEILSGLALVNGSIWVYDEANDELVRTLARGMHAQLPARLSPSAGIPGWVFTTCQPYTSREFGNDPYAPLPVRAESPVGWGGVCAPLRLAGEMIGTIFVTTQLPRELSADESQLVSQLAEMIDQGLHASREPLDTPLNVQRLGALRTVDSAITASLDPHVTLNVILDQVTTRLSVSAADILLLAKGTQVLEHAAGRGFYTDIITHSRISLGAESGWNDIKQAFASRRCTVVPDLTRAGQPFGRPELLAAEGFITYFAVPLIARGQVKGVLELFNRRVLNPDPAWIDFLEALAAQAAIAIDNATLFSDLQRSNAELAQAYDTTLEGWSHALDLRDRETEDHTRRVSEMTVHLAKFIGVNDDDLVHIRRGALLHDIGKMGTPDSILSKPGPLSDEEWQIMRKHPVYAYEMLSPIAFLRPALDIPYCHHEKWDGTGYPRGLKGEQIPLWARIFAVVDVWDALSSDRPYRSAWPTEQVQQYLLQGAGTHFDPEIVAAFLTMLA
ncbi:MAG: GAF domain-containing protein [Chloroflexi bacterium]|nr:GAF domain-containing protein [Chloroflexota bacterium]